MENYDEKKIKIFKNDSKNEGTTAFFEILELVKRKFKNFNESDQKLISAIFYLGYFNYVHINERNIINIIKEQKIAYKGNKKDFSLRIIKSFNTISNINSKSLQAMYSHIMKFEISLGGYLISILNLNNISLKPTPNIHKYIENSKIVNKMYFSEKIILLKILFKEGYIENIKESILISKTKYNFLLKKKYKSFPNKEEKIFEEIISIFGEIKIIRNLISHNDLVMAKKESIGKLFSSLERIEENWREDETSKVIIEIKKIINEQIDEFSKKQNLTALYSNFLNYKKDK